MRMRDRGLSQVTTSRQAATLQAGHLRQPPDGNPPAGKPGGGPPGGKSGGGPPGETVARGNVPGRLPGLAARRKGVLEPGPLPKTSASVTATNVSLGRGGGTKTTPRTKPLPAPLKLPLKSNIAPIAAPETASSAPTTPWQLPSSCLPNQLPKFPFNSELPGLPNKLPKLLGASQPSTPTRPDCLQQDLAISTNKPAEEIPGKTTSEKETTVGSLETPLKTSSVASPTAMATSPQSDTADLSSLKGIIQVLLSSSSSCW